MTAGRDREDSRAPVAELQGGPRVRFGEKNLPGKILMVRPSKAKQAATSIGESRETSRPERQGAGAASLSARLPVARRSPESAPCSRTAPPSVFSPLRGPAEHRPVKEEEFSAAAEEDTGTQFAPIIKLEEVAVTTGEEDKDVLLDM
jgi:hypothetical protein